MSELDRWAQHSFRDAGQSDVRQRQGPAARNSSDQKVGIPGRDALCSGSRVRLRDYGSPRRFST